MASPRQDPQPVDDSLPYVLPTRHLSDKALAEFVILYEKEFGGVLSYEEAREKAEGLVSLYRLVYGSEEQLQNQGLIGLEQK